MRRKLEAVQASRPLALNRPVFGDQPYEIMHQLHENIYRLQRRKLEAVQAYTGAVGGGALMLLTAAAGGRRRRFATESPS